MIKNYTRLLILSFPLVTGCHEKASAGAADALQGILELDEQLLAFEVGGRIKKINVKRGDEVQAGQALAELDDTLERPLRDAREAELRAAQAQSQLVRAGARREEVRTTEAQLVAARENEAHVARTVKRQEGLSAQGAGAPAVVEDLQSQLARAQAERQSLEQRLSLQKSGARVEENSAAAAKVKAAEASLQAVDARLIRYVLRAPVAGRVLEVHLDPGDVVSPGAAVLTVADGKRPYADVFVPEGRLAGVKLGVAASLRVDGYAQPFRGVVEDVARHTEFTPKFLFSEKERPNLVVRVRVRVEDPDEKLHAGVPAFVTVAR